MCLQCYIFIFNEHNAVNDDFLHTFQHLVTFFLYKLYEYFSKQWFWYFMFSYLKMWNVFVIYVAHVDWTLLWFNLYGYWWQHFTNVRNWWENLIWQNIVWNVCQFHPGIFFAICFENLLDFLINLSLSLSTHNFFILKFLEHLRLKLNKVIKGAFANWNRLKCQLIN